MSTTTTTTTDTTTAMPTTTETVAAAMPTIRAAVVRYALNLFSPRHSVRGVPLGGHEFRHQALDAARRAALATPHGVVQIVKDRKIWGHVYASKGGTYTRRAA